ncbi:hypothetical protein [Desulfitibacter alkalitolerans]|uniref:hypothetical protein n=1 Tax=Desulfitibacter alkalitolerans TaxID=264641 RepID=UPI00048826E2|nr:hypothetical protein [Desulfitibacter alkalitolerans]
MHALSRALSKKQSNKWSKVNRLSLLILGLVLLYFFVAVGLPFLSQLAGFSEAHQVIIDEKIEAGAWFYIFVEQMREIEPRVRHTLQYTPGTDKSD